MKILPDYLPDLHSTEEDAILEVNKSLDGRAVHAEELEHLIGKNVMINFLNGSTEIGLLQYKGWGHAFRVGSSGPLYFTDVQYFREV
jgi:hypothetical protein